MKHFDVLIIGAGQAATPLAYDLAKAGKKVAIAERRFLGGSCVNFGCTPSKAVIYSARLAAHVRRGEEFGLRIDDPKPDFKAVMDRARSIVMESRNGLLADMEKTSNPSLLKGHARFVGKHAKGYELKVDEEHVTAEIIVIDTGTRSKLPQIPGLRESKPITAGSWIEMEKLPSSIVFLGAGIVSMEMAQFFARMGSQVTIMESQSRPLAMEEKEVSECVQEALKRDGVKFMCACTLEEVKKVEAGYRMIGSHGTTTANCLFVATGRRPNTDELNLAAVDIEVDEKGIVPVDPHLKGGENIYAVGDIHGGIQTTHTSWDDYRIVKSQLVGDRKRTTNRIIPYAIFTDPQVGRVGMDRSQATKAGKDFRVGRYDMKHNGRAREDGEREGYCEVIVENGSDKLLGATVFAAEAAEMIEAYALLMNCDGDIAPLRDTIVTHPTYMEAVQGALEAAG